MQSTLPTLSPTFARGSDARGDDDDSRQGLGLLERELEQLESLRQVDGVFLSKVQGVHLRHELEIAAFAGQDPDARLARVRVDETEETAELSLRGPRQNRVADAPHEGLQKRRSVKEVLRGEREGEREGFLTFCASHLEGSKSPFSMLAEVSILGGKQGPCCQHAGLGLQRGGQNASFAPSWELRAFALT